MQEARHPARTVAAGAFTYLVLAVFRLNGDLLAAGDKLVADIGLSSARWQVLGAVALAGTPLTVSQIARKMGLTRQSVQRVVNELTADGLVDLRENPHHRRAKLVVLPEAGERAYGLADQRQATWANRITDGLPADDIAAAARVLGTLSARLAADQQATP